MEIKQQIDVRATPAEIYDTLMSSEKFATFTDAAAEIDPSASIGNPLSLTSRRSLATHRRAAVCHQ